MTNTETTRVCPESIVPQRDTGTLGVKNETKTL